MWGWFSLAESKRMLDMYMDTKKDLDSPQARLKQLRQSYQERLPRRLDRLEYLISTIPVDRDYTEDNATVRSGLNMTYQEAHKLAGSAGSVGLNSVSTTAKRLLDLIDRWFGATPKDPEQNRSDMLELVQQMRTMDFDEETELCQRFYPGSRKIHIIEDNELVANEMLLWLEAAGFDAQVFLSATIYGDTYEVLPTPDLILMDVIFGNERSAGPRVIEYLKRTVGRMPPVAFVSVRDDIEARLAAFRSGASRYLTKPVSQTELIDLAHEFTDRKDSPPFRVLTVDDDETTLQVNQVQLEQAGFAVYAVSNPMDALEAARAFEPDVILLDVIMPDVSGTELAAVMRQDRRLDAVPILFLTTETHPDQKIMGAALGGDDYIIKPFDPDYLLTTLRSRARRSRRLRELIRQAESV